MNRCDDIKNEEMALGILPEEERSAREAHLRDCPRCAREVEAYRVLFERLRGLPLPPVPAGIPVAVLARLRPAPFWSRLRDRLIPLVHRPITGPVVGGPVGFLLALYGERLILIAGRLVGVVVAARTSDLLAALRGGITELVEWTRVVEALVRLLLKLEPLVRILGETVPALAGPISLLSIGLSLAVLLFLGRYFGQIRREEIGHAEH